MTLLTSPSDLQLILRLVNTSRSLHKLCSLPNSGVLFWVRMISAQALKPPLTVGTGAVVNYGRFLSSWVCRDNSLTSCMRVTMVSVVNSQRDAILSPTGTNVWSGQVVQSLNSNAVTWSLAKELYGPTGEYFIVPLSLLIGIAATVIQWFISRVCGPVVLPKYR